MTKILKNPRAWVTSTFKEDSSTSAPTVKVRRGLFPEKSSHVTFPALGAGQLRTGGPAHHTSADISGTKCNDRKRLIWKGPS